MTGDTHYDLEILAELAEGLLDVDTARRVREHLAVCDPCGELLADLSAVREVLAATPTPAMPMGVALRIDKALAAEAEFRRGGVGLAETPDWDELMRDAPWERPVEVAAEAAPEPVRLGVVSDDGTIVPAKRSRRRRWAMPAIAAAAAVAVVGTAVATTGLLASGGGGSVVGRDVLAGPATETSAVPSRVPTRARSYGLTDSGHNYSDQDLRQPLEGMFGFQRMVGGGSDDDGKVDKCVKRISSRSKLPTYAVDQGQYNGQEALIVASWKDKASQRLRIDIVDPFNCKNLRKPALGRW
ncbi:zf-HC2 domain-containing protein [Nonomuraea sp. NPDC005650]|uniref:anti-sigma factor family protein n=1 Tax=Nonomuraea sp. NPDC005650 TaxID=3157045 RepID=UPI0033BCD195